MSTDPSIPRSPPPPRELSAGGETRRAENGGARREERRPARRSGAAGGGVPGALFYWFSWSVSRLVMLLLWDYRVHGAHGVPRSGPVILAANHASVLDPVLVGCGIRRRAAFLARETLFRVPVLGLVIRWLGANPIPRESLAPREALERAVEVAKSGKPLVLFPEGTRSHDGRMGDMKRGAGWIARRSGAAVIPVRVVGAYEAWPRHRRWPRFRPIRVFFGEPLRYDQKESVDAFLERLRCGIESLGSVEHAPEGGAHRPEEHPGEGGGNASRVSEESAAEAARVSSGCSGEVA